VTSLEALGVAVTMADVDAALQTAFVRVFGPTLRGETPPTP
jgi:lipoate-protein ligase B